MESVQKVMRSSAGNPRKRNLLFLTGGKRTCLTNSISLSSKSDFDIKMENNTSTNITEKRKVVSGPTINIDINEKIEIRLGQAHSKIIKEHDKSERLTKVFNKEERINSNPDNPLIKRKLPDLKPIASTSSSLRVLSKSSNPKEYDSKESKSKDDLSNNMIILKEESIQSDAFAIKRRKVEISQNASATKRSKWKCKKCSFQHSSKEEVVLHVRHAHRRGESKDINLDVTDGLTLPQSNSNCIQDTVKEDLLVDGISNVKEIPSGNDSQPSSATRGPVFKAYGCEACPYKTGCKSQFINHARFHRPNNGDFKCKHCTYNVTHKHLLLQHVRVHGLFDISSESITEPKSQDTDTSTPNNEKSTPLLYNHRKSSKSLGTIKRITKQGETTLSHRRTKEIRQQNWFKTREMAKTTVHLCNECPARFFDEKHLKTHSTFHSTKFRIKCTICTYSSVQKEHIASHMKVHTKIYQFKTRKLLSMCAKARLESIDKVQNVEKNVQRIKNNDNTKSSPITSGPNTNDTVVYCEICPSKFCSGILYRQHSVYHGKQASFQCTICNFGTDTSTELAIHKLVHAGSDIETATGNHWMKFGVFVKNENITGLQPGNRAKYYKCNKCPFEFSKRDRYELHLKQHGSNQKFTCTICDFSVNLYVNYVQHLKKHISIESGGNELSKVDREPFGVHSERSTSPSTQGRSQLYKCDICPFYAVDEQTVIFHKKKHQLSSNRENKIPSKPESLNAEVSLTCSYCEFTTSDNVVLQEHEESHSTTLGESLTLQSTFTKSKTPLNGTNDDDLDLTPEENNTASSED